MGTGTYGHATKILLRGQEKAAATRAKKKREARYASITAEDIAKEHLSEKARVCPSCRRRRSETTCAHHHPEDNELFEIPTVEVEFLVVEPGTAKGLG